MESPKWFSVKEQLPSPLQDVIVCRCPIKQARDDGAAQKGTARADAALYGARKKYTVTIEETVSKDFEVIAESEEEARKLAERKYLAGEFVLDDCTVTDKQMRACANPEDDTDWHRF